ncbi:helix-turn-helix domain-containing protein, partial [Corynebacterium sp. CCUG 65737]|uniref:helix-turn-helix domain-containing protein n=1 Tax=Corynebacterium sp. CCUG 65737 TaxID=2823889 RepID=UPI00210EA0FA
MNSPNRNLAIVKAVRDQGEPVTKVAKRFGISRQRMDLTPFWWTPDIQPGWAGKKGNLPPC